MSQTIFYLIIGILVFDFIFQFILDYLNTTRWTSILPDELKNIYDKDEYKRSMDYQKTKFKLGLFTSSLSFLLILFFILFGIFGSIDTWVQTQVQNPILQALLFFGIIALGADLLSTPFSIYSVFVIEERFGFNKTTFRTFVLDKIKSWFLLAIIGGGLLALIVWIYLENPATFWIWVWIVLALFSLFMSIFYSSLIVPLFNKQEKLEEGELRNEIEVFSSNVNFRLKNIFKIDGSKRSSKANAYFTGLGPRKRIVLYDTLIEKQENNEIVAVLAHEVGHYKKKHIISSLILSLLSSLLMLFILSLFIKEDSTLSLALVEALGGTSFSFHLGILAFGLLYGPFSFITGTLMNIWSRKNEYEADQFARDNYDGDALGSALIKLSVDSLSNLRPHPAYVFFHYSHPTLLQRLARLRRVAG